METEETKPVEREAAFTKIMGGDMPDDQSPEYDRWLFDQTWEAALERAAQATRCYKCEAEIRALKGRE